MRRRYDNHVHDSTYLSRDKLSDAAKADDLIAEVSGDTGKQYTVLAIVEDWASKERQRVKSVTLNTLFDQFIAARSSRSEPAAQHHRGRLVETLGPGTSYNLQRYTSPRTQVTPVRR